MHESGCGTAHDEAEALRLNKLLDEDAIYVQYLDNNYRGTDNIFRTLVYTFENSETPRRFSSVVRLVLLEGCRSASSSWPACMKVRA
jgi:hypothetical protein